MEIAEVEIHEFNFELPNVGTKNRQQVYEPGSTLSPSGFILTIRTHTGLEGHYRGFMFTPPMIGQIKMAAPEYVVGRDPLNREGIWQDIWQAYRHTDHLGLGPIDVALWDLAGKYYDDSVANLLGGFRDTIPAYASTYYADDAPDGLSSPDKFAEFAETCRSDGYDGFKIHPYGEPGRDIEICRTVAEAVGDEMDLMLDASSVYETYMDALEVGKALDEAGFYWYEDPMADTGQSTYAARQLRDKIDTPILLGEHVRSGPYTISSYLDSNTVSLVRSDVHLSCGITGVMKAAATAETFGADIELVVGGPGNLHCLSAIRNTNYFEHGLLHPKVDWMNKQGFTKDIEQPNADGEVEIPDGPGLGVDIDWAFVESHQTDHTLIK